MIDDNYISSEIMEVVIFIKGNITLEWGTNSQIVVMKIPVTDASFTTGQEALLSRIERIRPMLSRYEIMAFKLEDLFQVITFSEAL